MERIALISSVSKKKLCKAKASELYTSTLFIRGREYIKKLNPDKWFILSAAHGLLHPNTTIGPYNVTLNKMSRIQRREWAKKVIRKLCQYTNLQKDHFIILAEVNYREYLIQDIKSYEVPMEKLPIGKQLQFLKRACKE